MTVSDLIELTVEECLSLLHTKSVGRIGLVTPQGPMIFPVNYALAGDALVFRTLPYGVIANNAHDAQVAFEVDSLDEEMRTGWSVLAVGRSEHLSDPAEVRVVREDWDPEPWAEGVRNLYFRVEWVGLTGRQLGLSTRPSLIPQAPRA